jgi:hypothetical protein
VNQTNPKIALQVIPPTTGPSLSAPPILVASSHTVDYTCGGCGTVLVHAELHQVYNLVVRCTVCETFNTTEL